MRLLVQALDVRDEASVTAATERFFTRTSERFATIPAPEAYRPFIQKQMAAFQVEPPAGHLATEDDVAAAVLTAASDETGLTRFRVGGDTLDAARARRQPDADYDAWRLTHVAAN